MRGMSMTESFWDTCKGSRDPLYEEVCRLERIAIKLGLIEGDDTDEGELSDPKTKAKQVR